MKCVCEDNAYLTRIDRDNARLTPCVVSTRCAVAGGWVYHHRAKMPLADLDDDIIESIFTRISVRDLVMAERCCVRF